MKSKSTQLAPCAAFALIALVAVALLSGAPASAAGHRHHGKRKLHPAGAVKLPKSRVRHVKGVTCGELHKKWVPGTIVHGYFLSDSQQAHNFGVLAKHAKGKSKAADTKLSKKFAKRAKARLGVCGKGPSGGNRDSTNPGKPLRFNFNGAIGLALRGSSAGGTTSRLNQPQTRAVGSSATASAGVETGSNLETIGANGQVGDAVTSGKATIEKTLVGPDGKVYVVFGLGGADLENTGGSSAPGAQRCILAQVDPATGVPSCIDSSLTRIFANIWSSAGAPINPPVQFDASGAIYYAGSTSGGTLTVRKWSNGATKDLIAPSGISIREFLVMPDGTVFITGLTQANNAQWTRRIAPDGSLHPLLDHWAYFMARYPDGKPYFGVFPIGATAGVDSYDGATGQLASTWWIANSEGFEPPSGGEANDSKSICGPSSTVPFTVKSNFCPGSYISQSITTGGGKVFAIADAQGTGVAMQYYPNLAIVPTAVGHVSVAAAKGNDLLLSGSDSSGDQILTDYDPSSETETQLLGPPATADQYEIFHMSYLEEGNKILFDGQRFSDNQYVIGEYDLNTHQVNVVASSTSKWADLQGL
jgi:hypothetical protein